MKFTNSLRTSLYTAVGALLLTLSSFAQAPEKMSYQAVIRGANNALVTNQQVGMQISILQGSTAVYEETQTPTSNTNGLVSLEIGTGTVISGSFTAIDWSAGTYFIKIETDSTGGTNYTITGTSQLLSVPFALYAKTSSDAGAVAANTAKVGYTDELVSANTDVAANTAKVGYTEAAVSANTDVAANTAKVGYTETAVSANTDVAANIAKVGYTDELVSANTDVAANTAKVGYTEAAVSANTDVAANTAKVGYTEAAVSANTDVAANTAKVGYTDELVSANTDVAANTLKVGITAQQASDITSNNAKTGITSDQADAIIANTSGIATNMTNAQRQAISNPAAGLQVFVTDFDGGSFMFYDGTKWGTLSFTKTIPDAPTIGTVVAGNQQATVPFTAPSSDGGSAITSYTATSSPEGRTGTLSQSGSGSITVTGLTNGSAYTFTVTATNAIGTSAASAASNSITPPQGTAAINHNNKTYSGVSCEGFWLGFKFSVSDTQTITALGAWDEGHNIEVNDEFSSCPEASNFSVPIAIYKNDVLVLEKVINASIGFVIGNSRYIKIDDFVLTPGDEYFIIGNYEGSSKFGYFDSNLVTTDYDSRITPLTVTSSPFFIKNTNGDGTFPSNLTTLSDNQWSDKYFHVNFLLKD